MPLLELRLPQAGRAALTAAALVAALLLLFLFVQVLNEQMLQSQAQRERFLAAGTPSAQASALRTAKGKAARRPVPELHELLAGN